MLKQKLKLEQKELNAERRRREEGVAALTKETIALKHATHHLTAITFHATSCRNRRKCSICVYARRTFANTENHRSR
jgi:uncharacterized Fe-S cluster-containing MiaB family protein